MNLDFKGQKAFVSGSTAGIGFAIAHALVAGGAAVTINGRTSKAVDAAIQRLRSLVSGADVSGVAVDLGTQAGCDEVAGMLADTDILVNNLGIFEPKPFAQIEDADWQRMFDVNVMSGVRLSRAALPGMLRRNHGRIVFVSSESGICPPAEMVHYGMSKSAQLSIARGLAECCAGTRVTVNSVLPGPTLTEGAKTFFDTLAASQGISFDEAAERFFREARPTSLLRRFIHPEEVAAMVTYICSPQASATTGAALRVDGGVVRTLT
ncbi:MAG: SDR family oxidoreductase [Burkholderiaceae bacterium]